ncbi:MAG: hypothetical protein ACRDIL_04655 [Candidatus Limnocylindrales bacterium]
MAGTELTGLSGDPTNVTQERLDAFAAGFGGQVLKPGDDAFAEATQIWNGMITIRPGLVLRPSTTQDVVSAVAFARDNQL